MPLYTFITMSTGQTFNPCIRQVSLLSFFICLFSTVWYLKHKDLLPLIFLKSSLAYKKFFSLPVFYSTFIFFHILSKFSFHYPARSLYSSTYTQSKLLVPHATHFQFQIPDVCLVKHFPYILSFLHYPYFRYAEGFVSPPLLSTWNLPLYRSPWTP